MLHEDLEFRINQYIDGDLDESQRHALESEIEQNPAAAELIAQYRRIDQVLKTSLPLPEVDYDALSARISQAIESHDQPHVVFSFKWVRRAVSVAAVVGILLIGGWWINRMVSPGESSGAFVQITGPQSESAYAEPIQVIHIGPSHQDGPTPASEAIVARPSRLVIASASAPVQDDALPY